MKKVFYKRDNVELLIDTEPFASGGEGNLYKIQSPPKFAKFVVKLYHQGKRTQARQQKVEYMISNPPIHYTEQNHYPIIWPQGLIFERSGFAGFLMPFAQGEKLEILCMPRLHRNLKTQWGRFDFSQSDAMQKRLSLCFNIATAVYQVHATDHYVLVDLKTDNIIIQNNGFISIVDMDSVEVIDGNSVLFPATVTTPEYTPPEYYTKNVQPGKQAIYESWDLFSLAVIFYKLLFGIHPYAASCHPPYDKMVSLHEKIEAGLFVHSSAKSSHFKVVPPPHRKFETVNPAIQRLFIRTFEEGHENPEIRPDADEWCWAIAPAPRFSIDRPLPSRVANIEKVTYSKPLHVTTDTSQILPSLPPPKLPVIAPVDFYSSMITPRAIVGTTTALFLIWVSVGGLSYMLSGIFQVATFLGSTLAMLYAYYRELPEVKEQRLIEKSLDKLRLQRKNTNMELVNIKTQMAQLPNKQKAIITSFEKYQQQNLIFEKKEIEKLVQDLRSFLSSQDKKVIDLLKEEIEETQALQRRFFGTTYELFKHLSRIPINEQLQWLEKEKTSVTKRVELKYHHQMMNIQQEADKHKEEEKVTLKKIYDNQLQDIDLEINELENKRKQEENRIKTTKQIKVSEQLRRYGIRDNAQTIFSDNGSLIGVICDYLERNGVRSAADFIDVNAEGKVQKVNAQHFEKVPFMTPERGVELKNWLTNLKTELGRPEELTPEEIEALDKRFDNKRLLQKIETIKLDYYQAANKLAQNNHLESERSRIRQDYEQELKTNSEKIEVAIQVLTENQAAYKIAADEIKSKYNSQQEAVITRANAFREEIKSQIAAINLSTFNNNSDLLNKVTSDIESTTSISEMTAILTYNEKQKSLNDLDTTYHELKTKDESLRNLTFKGFLKKMAKLNL